MKQLTLIEETTDWKDPLGYLKNREEADKDSPIVVSYGGGKNSTAMLIAMVYKGIVPNLILFADTGAELPETYDWINKFSSWLVSNGFPAITVVKKEQKEARKERKSVLVKWKLSYKNLEWFYLELCLGMLANGHQYISYGNLYEKCVALKTLPSRTFNRGECSMSWKVEPQERYTKNWYKGTAKIRKFIGYHAGEVFRLINKSKNPFDDDTYRYEYPLIDWGLHEHHCVALISSIGLGIPPKSSCFFCPNRKRADVVSLKESHPELYEAACFLEENFIPRENAFVGLGRRWRWSDIDTLTPLEQTITALRDEQRVCACLD